MTSTTKTTGDFDENQGILNQTVHRLDDDFNLSFHSISIIREFHINDPFCYSRNTFVLRQEILERKYTIFIIKSIIDLVQVLNSTSKHHK